MADGKNDIAWSKILDENHNILSTIKNGQIYKIQANEIKQFREPRLMTKHDTSEYVPSPLKKHNINVLPLSRSEYALGDFSLFEPFPDMSDQSPKFCSLPDFETLTTKKLTSESNAINALLAAGILDDFLGVENTVATFNGRMGTGHFDFWVDRKSARPAEINVRSAQLEIDGGFENDDSVVIMEAKNVLNEDFHIRQLYYPFRKYHAFVKKPIRLVFSQYTNLTYYLYEYEFEEPNNYNSLSLLRRQAYTFEDTRITASDLKSLWESTHVIYTDNQDEENNIPFIQADRIDRIISLMEGLSNVENHSMTREEVAQFLGMVPRQAAYYPTAGRYLGLFESSKGLVSLTPISLRILKLGRRDRHLELVRLMLQHQIFHTLFAQSYTTGCIPPNMEVERMMIELNVCNPGSTASRRANTVASWLKWIFSLIEEE